MLELGSFFSGLIEILFSHTIDVLYMYTEIKESTIYYIMTYCLEFNKKMNIVINLYITGWYVFIRI